jgi:hypothetical protein
MDYWAEGRTAESLGLAGMSLKQIRRFILEGEGEIAGKDESVALDDERSVSAKEAP